MTLISIDKQIKDANNWLNTWKRQKKKALILYGYVGTGKTTLAYQVSKEHNYEVVEYNASELRDKAFMQKLEYVTQQQTFEPTLILLEEIDTQEARINELKEIIETTKKPIIITSNYYKKISGLLKICKVLKFYKPKLSDLCNVCDIKKLSECGVSEFRQAMAINSGSQGYVQSIEDNRERLTEMIHTGRYGNVNNSDLIYFLDSSIDLSSFELYQWIKTLDCWDICRRDIVFEGKPEMDIKEFYYTKKRFKEVKDK